jgi:glutamate racemase
MIGFFDSGSGGLSVLSHFKKMAPSAGVLYFGDIANAPYGEKTAEELSALTELGVDALRQRGATAIVSACNSVSPSILAGASGEMPFVEMTTPTAGYMRQYAGKRFLLLATPATVASGIYERALGGIVSLDSLGLAGLAGAIEFDEPQEKIASILKEALSAKNGERYDGVILACTHYPLALSVLAPILKEHFGEVPIIDPGEPVATDAARAFEKHEGGLANFFISKESEAFRARVAALFPEGSYSIEII